MTTPDRRAALAYFFRFGWVSFGGPAGQIAQLHRDLVHERRWIPKSEFQQALNVCMLLPGPEALQLVIFLGSRWFGAVGGVTAGVCFLLPGALLMLGLAWLYLSYGDLAPVAAALRGLQAVVLALVSQAVWRLAKRSLTSGARWAIALLALVALLVFQMPFPLTIVCAALLGMVCFRGAVLAPPSVSAPSAPRFPLRLLVLGLVAWLMPLVTLWMMGASRFSYRLYLFFSKVALLGFGGAYALLAWVNETLVTQQAWLLPPDLVAGVALAETTPGPLTLVLPFYGFVAGFRQAPLDSALIAGIIHAVLAAWATFLPSFVMVIAGGRYFEHLARVQRLAAALEGVTAAVVGIMASFGLAIGASLLWMPAQGHFDLALSAVAVVALWALTRTTISILWVLTAAALVSCVLARL